MVHCSAYLRFANHLSENAIGRLGGVALFWRRNMDVRHFFRCLDGRLFGIAVIYLGSSFGDFNRVMSAIENYGDQYWTVIRIRFLLQSHEKMDMLYI
ncbi:hypothetical protein Nepgr_013833 [Nepenthes gracilis]|uniref:Uncharacterized protein n=1 Tax=Nepenthes gracilis TaxID=150966 RepID=A0AAD3SJ30_NEPGR|nr:hypothetical protein Nepgr_013833 [Nepenthes gracilis]